MRSVPLVLGDGTSLRFDRADIKEMEGALGIGYPHFIRPGIFGSLTATEVFIWRGLRKENEKGELVHVFPLNEKGREEAGNLLMSFIAEKGPAPANDAVIDALFECGLFKRKTPEQPEENPEGPAPKNLLT